MSKAFTLVATALRISSRKTSIRAMRSGSRVPAKVMAL